MGISQLFGNAMNQTAEGSTSAAVFKLLALAALPVAALIANFESSKEPGHALFKDLDGRATTVFPSVQACVDKGFPQTDCEASQQKALDFSKNVVTVTYSSSAECVTNHGKCDQRTSLQHKLISAGDQAMIGTVPHTAYVPRVIAWQAAIEDLHVSAPLYPTTKKGLAMRKDGKTFGLNPGA